jgi:NAD(P)-dependent dehydrogenase (short-subunit alcohol dehydrogenase family)
MTLLEHAENDIRLDGQVALVTGGGRGLGRAMALALSAAGAAVAVCARTATQLAETVKLIEERGGKALAIAADMLDRNAIESMVARVERELGPIDLLVNNAGVSGTIGPLAQTDPDAWWNVQIINVRGPLYCSRAVLPGMIQRGRGRIVNVSSGAGFQAWPLVSAYAVSKAALFRFSENLAAETREQGIQVFAITPGLVRTDMVEDILHCGEPSVEQDFQQDLADGHDIPPERSAQMVVFLASGKADALSGRFIRSKDDEKELVARAAEIQAQDLFVLRQRV